MAEARESITPEKAQQLNLFAQASSGNNKILLQELSQALDQPQPNPPPKAVCTNAEAVADCFAWTIYQYHVWNIDFLGTDFFFGLRMMASLSACNHASQVQWFAANLQV